MSNALIDAGTLNDILKKTLEKIKAFQDQALHISANYTGDLARHPEHTMLISKVEVYRQIEDDIRSLLSIHRKLSNEDRFIDEFIDKHPHFRNCKNKPSDTEKYNKTVNDVEYMQIYRKRVYHKIFKAIDQKTDILRQLSSEKLSVEQQASLESSLCSVSRFIGAQRDKLPSFRRSIYKRIHGLPSRKLYFELMMLHSREGREEEVKKISSAG